MRPAVIGDISQRVVVGLFDIRVLRRIFGPKSEEVRGEYTKLKSRELYVLFSSTNIIPVNKTKKNEMGMVCSTYGGEERCI
jgi:hypothetical protein